MSNLKEGLKSKSMSISPNKIDKAKTMNYNSIASQLSNQHNLNLKDERNKYKVFSGKNTLNMNFKQRIEEKKFEANPNNIITTDNAQSHKDIINTQDFKQTDNNAIFQNISLDKDCSNVNTKLHKTSKSVYEPRKIQQYNIDGSIYDFVKTQDKIKIGKDDGNFMKRMVLDVFIRQTKDNRVNELLEKRKITIDESDKVKTFNRLIEDANRRMEALDNLENLKMSIKEPLPVKKFSYEQFSDVYDR
jgi:hypothetical protein